MVAGLKPKAKWFTPAARLETPVNQSYLSLDYRGRRTQREPRENLERTCKQAERSKPRTLFLWGVTIAGFWFDSFLWTNYFWILMCILLVIKEGLKWGNKEVMFWFFHVRELEQSISNNMRNVSFLLEELILFNNHLCPWNRSCAFIKLHCDTAHLLPVLGVPSCRSVGLMLEWKRKPLHRLSDKTAQHRG